MKTTPTSSRYSESPAAPSVEACFDELLKIAEASEKRPAEIAGKGAGKWWKNTLIIGAGSAGGIAGATLADAALMKAIGPQWRSLSSMQRAAILGPIAAAAGIGAQAAARNLQARREEADRE